MSKVLQVFNKDERLKIDQIPIECPYCHNYQLPSMYGAYLYAYGEYLFPVVVRTQSARLHS